jgi:hypothetical protein
MHFQEHAWSLHRCYGHSFSVSSMLRYRTLNSLAMRLLPPEGGLLMTCSCSGAVAQSSGHFLGMLRVSGALAAAASVQLCPHPNCTCSPPSQTR